MLHDTVYLLKMNREQNLAPLRFLSASLLQVKLLLKRGISVIGGRDGGSGKSGHSVSQTKFISVSFPEGHTEAKCPSHSSARLCDAAVSELTWSF